MIGIMNPTIGLIVDPNIVKASPKVLKKRAKIQLELTKAKVTKKFALKLI